MFSKLHYLICLCLNSFSPKDSKESEAMAGEVLYIKIMCTVALGVSVFLVGFLPLALRNINKGYLSLLTSFSGGILLGTVLLHLIPEVIEYGDAFKCYVGVKREYPIEEFAIVVGFILIMLIEKIVEERQNSSRNGEETPLLRSEVSSETSCNNLTEQLCSKDTPKNKTTIGSYLMVMALAIHSVFEGLAIGIARSSSDTITIFLAVIIHKLCLAFALGLKLQQEHRTKKEHAGALAMFTISSPIGVIVGIVITNSLEQNSLNVAMFLTNAIAAGTFLYITFMEIIGPEFNTRYINQVYKVFAVVFGILIITFSLYFFHDYEKVNCLKNNSSETDKKHLGHIHH